VSIRLALLLALAAIAFGQTPEVRGTVIELGSNIPIAGVKVTLSEFVPIDNLVTRKQVSTTFTGTTGAYSFKPGHTGQFYLVVTKEGYVSPAVRAPGSDISERGGERPTDLTDGKPLVEEHFTLVRPGSIIGRLIDENEKPITDVRVTIVRRGPTGILNSGVPAVTAIDGSFTGGNLLPGAYLVRVGPPTRASVTSIAYSEAEAKIVEQDVEVSYWPGGTPDSESALPIQVVPSLATSIGTIRVRKVPYYRAHITADDDCSTNKTWNMSLIDQADSSALLISRPIPCRQSFILPKLRPGRYELALRSGSPSSAMDWSLTPFAITNRNIAVQATFSPAIDIPIQFAMTGNAPLPSLASTRVSFRTPDANLPINDPPRLEKDGRATARVSWPLQTLFVDDLPNNLYIKELRYNRTTLSSRTFTPSHGAPLEIILDDNAASLSITVTDRDRPVPGASIFLVKWPPSGPLTRIETNRPATVYRGTDTQGLANIEGLAPGEYHIVAIPRETKTTGVLDPLLRNAQKITLDRGAQMTLPLKLTNP